MFAKFRLSKVLAVAIAMLITVSLASCSKTKPKIYVDTQLAVAVFNDTIAIRDVLNMLDSTSNSWLRVRNDSIFAYYADTVFNVIDASKYLGNIEDVSYNTDNVFTLNEIDDAQEKDTTLHVDRFSYFPLVFDDFEITEVVLRSGLFSFDFEVTPAIPMLKCIEVYSEQIVDEADEPLRIILDYTKGRGMVDLSNYRIIPDTSEIVGLSANITFHYVPSEGFPGGQYNCHLNCGLTNVKFKTVYGIVYKPMDSVFDDQTAIDFGIKGLTGSAVLPMPTINYTYRNTFGFGSVGDITKLKFINGGTGLVTNLLADDMVEVVVDPTNGEWRSNRILGFVDDIDALAGYTRLEFGGELMMATDNGHISISDTSKVDIMADIEIPMSCKISDLRYIDTFDVHFGGSGIVDMDFIDELDFFVDYINKIPLDVDLQLVFLRNQIVLDSLFSDNHSITYDGDSDTYRTVECKITENRVKNVLRANKIMMKLGVSTENITQDAVMLMASNSIALRLRLLTKSSEIDFNDVL